MSPLIYKSLLTFKLKCLQWLFWKYVFLINTPMMHLEPGHSLCFNAHKLLVKDERCDKDRLPSVSNGRVECKKSANRLQHRGKSGFYWIARTSINFLATYVDAGTVCEISCSPGYEISGLDWRIINYIPWYLSQMLLTHQLHVKLSNGRLLGLAVSISK